MTEYNVEKSPAAGRSPGRGHLVREEGRRSNVGSVDEDGKGARAQAIYLRNENETRAMGKFQRARLRNRHFWRRVCGCGGETTEEGVMEGEQKDIEGGGKPQYRLEARKEESTNVFKRFFQVLTMGSMSSTGLGVSNPNQTLAMYLHWMFRVNFFFLFILSCGFFFLFVICFAGFIIAAGKLDPTCVRVGGEPFGSAGQPFADGFALSWTTFSTVGYGSTYPALGNENENSNNCMFITLICSLEAFIGVLYSGFCGAILFGKVLRIQSHAQVLFSDPIVIRYGGGVETFEDDDDDFESGIPGGKEDRQKKIPCPVLEFRVVNRLFNEVGGEIMDATLNCVANIDADDVDPALRDALDAQRSAYLNSNLFSDTDSDGASAASTTETGDSERMEELHHASMSHKIKKNLSNLDYFSVLARRKDHRAVDEDPTSKLVSKRIFSKLLIEASDHPFFKRVWLARHILDEHSPILTQKVRKMIKKNGGHWPESLNHHDGVRRSLQFNQILVSLNGVSNVSASDVYAQKIYDFVDINVGYQFVNILYRGDDGKLKVDKDLINDVRVQEGGGGEPLI
eukprot:CAMPEP_0198289650 /NCGR_PEP_ID=MMETSP1449-20131203/7763_1 /TAXON_ID=420275 /ORGANISM="Attheya septentrionalis, Strain CCMP2084" /LENGTH=568 /DNA_ID=CAMNT_0043988013 /DNA_START=105 /DNA_END=1811 /DNA_ORIENTATION=-